MIHIVDYGLGNIGAFLTLYNKLNIAAKAVQTAEALDEADHILIPGVGAFDTAMKLLNESGMREKLEELVSSRKIPVLGVCVGMQILSEASDEGQLAGLGWIKGTARSLSSRQSTNQAVPLPHMGWNDVDATRPLALLKNIDQPKYYFLHSFYFDNSDPVDCAATAEYDGRFTCIVNRENVWGVQFHPEKSHSFGTGLLQNFANI